MAEKHVSEDLLGRFLRVEVTKSEAQEVVRHLLTGCDSCAALAHRLAEGLGPGAPAPADWEVRYEQVFQRALAFASAEEQRIALEKLRGWGQWAYLAPLHPQVRFALVESDPSYHTFGLYDRLLEASRWYTRTEPVEAVDVVRLALLISERLDSAKMGQERRADLQARAWAALGNARRLASDFEGARRSFNEAWRVLEEEGTNDPAERAHILGLEATYISDIGEFETAEEALGEALQVYREIPDVHMQGRTFLKMGATIGHIDPARGLAHIRNALSLIDCGTEPRLDLCAQHDLAWFLADNGQAEEALAVLERARPLYQQFPDQYTQLRLHWLEGRIAFRIGEYDQAENIFQQLWEEFRTRDLNHELVLVSIDLAEALVGKNEPNRAAELVEQCYPVLKGWGLHKDALAAWIVFQQALSRQQLGLFRRVREYYLRHWVRPGPFRMA